MTQSLALHAKKNVMIAPLITIIVPAYNAEKCVEQCLQSLFRQTYPNLEFVVVDDKSTDNTLDVLKHVIASDKRGCANTILVEHKQNLGVATSVMECVAMARGEYVMFCDIDDYYEPDMAQVMLERALRDQSDVVMSAYCENFPNRQVENHLIDGVGIDLNTVPMTTMYFARWNKLIKTSLLRDERLRDFPKINYWEDVELVSRVFALANKVSRVSMPLYHYRHLSEGTSLTEQNHNKRLEGHLECARFLDEWFVRHQLDAKYRSFLMHMKLIAKVKMLRGKNVDVRRWKSTFPEIKNCDIMKMKQLPLAYRCGFVLVNVLPVWAVQAVARAITWVKKEGV